MKIGNFKFTAVLLSLIVGFASSSASAEEEYPSAVISAGEAVYQIKLHGGEGTGFFIAPNLFVTNFHVIDDIIQNVSEVSFYFDGELSPIQAKKLVAISYPYDLALIQTQEKSSSYLIEGDEPQTNETVFTAGYPDTGADIDDLQYHHSTSSIKNWNDIYYTLFFNFGSGEGSSGSPVLDSEGHFFGIIFASNTTKKSAIHSSWLDLLTRKNIGTECQQSASVCIEREILRAKELMQSFLAEEESVERESLGIIHTTGSTLQDILNKTEGEEYLLKIAEDFEDASAQYTLGVIYRDRGNLEKAIDWLTLSAEQGTPLAQYGLGVIYRDRGNLEKAIDWLTLSAEQGTPLAQFNLGIIYRDRGNLEKAIDWLTLSAEQGTPLAQFNLGVILDKQGKLQEAAHWYKLAAEQGVTDAQFNLSEMYRYGEGVEQSDQLADYWMAKVQEAEGS